MKLSIYADAVRVHGFLLARLAGGRAGGVIAATNAPANQLGCLVRLLFITYYWPWYCYFVSALSNRLKSTHDKSSAMKLSE